VPKLCRHANFLPLEDQIDRLEEDEVHEPQSQGNERNGNQYDPG
jgi:hypothetical protein